MTRVQELKQAGQQRFKASLTWKGCLSVCHQPVCFADKFSAVSTWPARALWSLW